MRIVATRHFVTANRTACQGEDPVFFRVHMYCGSLDGSQSSAVALRHVLRPRLSFTGGSSIGGVGSGSNDDDEEEDGTARCDFKRPDFVAAPLLHDPG